jgi:hypothetical protein
VVIGRRMSKWGSCSHGSYHGSHTIHEEAGFTWLLLSTRTRVLLSSAVILPVLYTIIAADFDRWEVPVRPSFSLIHPKNVVAPHRLSHRPSRYPCVRHSSQWRQRHARTGVSPFGGNRGEAPRTGGPQLAIPEHPESLAWRNYSEASPGEFELCDL